MGSPNELSNSEHDSLLWVRLVCVRFHFSVQLAPAARVLLSEHGRLRRRCSTSPFWMAGWVSVRNELHNDGVRCHFGDRSFWVIFLRAHTLGFRGLISTFRTSDAIRVSATIMSRYGKYGFAKRIVKFRARITFVGQMSVCVRFHFSVQLEAGGKPSTWLPPGRLVEHFLSGVSCANCLCSPHRLVCPAPL